MCSQLCAVGYQLCALQHHTKTAFGKTTQTAHTDDLEWLIYLQVKFYFSVKLIQLLC